MIIKWKAQRDITFILRFPRWAVKRNSWKHNLELRAAAIDALGRFKDEQIHDLAIEFLETGSTEFGLTRCFNR